MALDPAMLALLDGRHPARRLAFAELRDGLERGIAAGNILVSRDGDLELFGYSHACQFEQRWDLFSLIARGLVLDMSSRSVVATPFPKFFNFNEGGVTFPAEPFEASEKIDGSLGIAFHFQGRWRVTTRGRLDSVQGQWATAHLNQDCRADALTPGTTYLLEIIYPENRIVIPYDFSGLVLLAAYDPQGDELMRPALEATASAARLRLASAYSYESPDEILNLARGLPRDQEGFVLRFQGGRRVKIKGEAYCRLHRLICHCTPLALWESMGNAEDLDVIRRELPEEMRPDFDTIRRLLQARFDALVDEVREAHQRMSHLGDKELGLLLQDPAAPLSQTQRKFAFACRHRNFLEAVHRPGEWRQKAFRLIRPDGNRLAGYVPSNAMTRFASEQ